MRLAVVLATAGLVVVAARNPDVLDAEVLRKAARSAGAQAQQWSRAEAVGFVSEPEPPAAATAVPAKIDPAPAPAPEREPVLHAAAPEPAAAQVAPVAREDFGQEAEVEAPEIEVRERAPLAREESERIRCRLDRVMDLAAGRGS